MHVERDTETPDPFQDRYVAHQARKAEVLMEIVRERHSDRMFSSEPVPTETITELVDSTEACASSCDRQAITIDIIADRDRKALLGGLLVGGVGWIHRASHVLMLFGNRSAYKAGDEITYMPYLDAGVKVHQLGVMAAAQGLHGCYVNPNIREMNRPHFEAVFGQEVFCGAYAVGLPHKNPDQEVAR